MAFEKIKGNANSIKELKEMIELGKIPPAIIFYGKEGIGKSLIAKEFAKTLLCKSTIDNAPIPCQDENEELCESCRMFKKNTHPDFLFVDLKYQAAIKGEKEETQKSIGVDTMREVIKFANLKPSYGKRKFIIINESEKMTTEAQNSILKTLEEPFEGTTIILITSSLNLLLPTVISRCYKIKFNPLTTSDVMDILIEKGYEIKNAEFLSTISEGSISIAIKYESIIKLLREYSDYKAIAPFLIVSKISKNTNFKETAITILNFINSFISLKMEKTENKENLINIINENFKYRNYINSNVNTKLVLSLALYKFFNNFNFSKEKI